MTKDLADELLKAKPLSDMQRYRLHNMVRYGDGTWKGGITNSTMCALEKRGLVTYAPCERDGWLNGKWAITDAGRAAIQPKGTSNE